MRCPKCGKTVPKNSLFCGQCGAPLELPEEKPKAGIDESAPYVHPSDRAALKALMAIPGFTPALKAFMKTWHETQYRIQNMSSCVRISEKQLPEYYDMLPPICEKLRIDVPELYLELDVNANAYTSGDTKPYIVMTSGLLETLPHELIPTVLAHECGHIDCHHVLYSTMGRMILNGAATSLNLFGLGNLVSLPLRIAFFYWMRCSEFSADRAAILCDGGYAKMAEICMRFAGFDKDIHYTANLDAFMEQAEEYKEMVASDKWNKTLEYYTLSTATHPLTAVRAYEAREWTKTEEYTKLTSGMLL